MKKFEMTFQLALNVTEKFNDKLSKFNRKAVKLGFSPVEVTYGEKYTHTYYDEFAMRKISYEAVDVTIKGDIPIIEGWNFLATIQHETEGNIIRRLPTSDLSIEIPESYRSVEAMCDHCGIKRFRKDTYIIFNSNTNEFKQVGSTCLKDFVGLNAHSLITYDRAIKELEESVRGEKVEEVCSLVYVIALGKAVVDGFGRYISRKDYDANDYDSPMPTVEAVKGNYWYPRGKNPDDRVVPTEEDMKYAVKIINWFKDTISTNATMLRNDYYYNMSVILKKEFIKEREFGFAISLIPMFVKFTATEEAKKTSTNNFFGNVGDKFEKTLTLKRKNGYESQWGYVYILIMNDEEGHNFVWKTSKYMELDEGASYTVKGTIKAHNDYKGTKQTEITRCKISQNSF